MASNMRSMSWPLTPTNGLPSRSSSAPGASPTIITGAPTTPSEIDDRRNELAGNLSLGQELRSIATVNQIAAELDVHSCTVSNHYAKIRTKLGVHSVAELLRAKLEQTFRP